ncbi:MAG: hypothetical protein ACR2KV_01865 [Solirubrobacteraceae bacterium]
MPDQEGNQAADSETETPLHAYGDGREEQAEEGSRGITGDQGTGDAGSYQKGGHEDENPSGGATPAPTDHSDAAGADTGAGAGAEDPDAATGGPPA